MTSTRLLHPAIEICDILSTATSKQIPNRKTTKKDITKQHSKQAKKREV